MSARQQNFRRQPYRFGKVSSDGSERRQKEISKAVPFEARTFLETVLKESRKQRFIFGEGNDAIAHVARRKHVELFAQPPARSAIVAHRHHAAQFPNRGLV